MWHWSWGDKGDVRVLPLGEPASSWRQHRWVNRTLRTRKNGVCYGRLRGGLLTEGHPRLGRHRPSPDLCGGLPAALLQPPRDSQRAKRHNAMPCVSVSQGFSQHRYQNPDSSPQPPGLHSSPRPLLPLLPFYFAMSPALSWDLHTCLSLIQENPCLNPCHSQHPLITQILAYLSPPQKGLHFASAISSLCKSLSIMCPCLISFTALVLV